MKIEFINCNRCYKNDMTDYYQKRFSDFKTENLTVSEHSPRKRGETAKESGWYEVDYEEAHSSKNPVWFKNASWFGRSRYYIKK